MYWVFNTFDRSYSVQKALLEIHVNFKFKIVSIDSLTKNQGWCYNGLELCVLAYSARHIFGWPHED